MTTPNNRPAKATEAMKNAFDKRVEAVGWAVFLIMSGALMIAPEKLFPEGSWFIGTGLTILGSMGIRFIYGIRVDRFWTILGILALSFGVSQFFSLNLPVFPALLIIIGVAIGYKVFFGKINSQRDFWKCCR